MVLQISYNSVCFLLAEEILKFSRRAVVCDVSCVLGVRL
jgi:hypothetical protein